MAQAAGLFIWAEIVVRFVEQGLPKEQLEHVLGDGLSEGDNITQLYCQIPECLFWEANNDTLNVFNQVMITLILAKILLHIDD